jgi:hypothetical protein
LDRFSWAIILFGLLKFTIIGSLCIRQQHEPIQLYAGNKDGLIEKMRFYAPFEEIIMRARYVKCQFI